MLEVIFSTNGVTTTLHDSNNLSRITEESNVASKLECVVYNTDESFNNIYPGLTDVQAYDTYTKELVFEGSVFSAKPSMSQSGEVKIDVSCVHLISRLTKANVVGYEDPSGNVRTIVSRVLEIYNATAIDRHKIYLGNCPYTQSRQMDEQIGVLHIFSATCFDLITQVVVEKAGWNFSARYSDGNWYLDIADSMGEFTPTDILAGVNMVDISKTVDANELYTRIIPIGAASYIPNSYKNPTMSHMGSAPEGMPLTLYGYDQTNPGKIYIANEKLENKYPVLEKVVQFDEIAATDDTDFHSAQSDLYNRGVVEAAKLTDIIETYETTAVDLSRAGYDYESFKLNRMYHIVNGMLNIDTWLKVTCKKTDYSNPAMSELTFGPVNKAAARYLSRQGKSTDQRLNELGTAAYRTTDTRTGGMSFRNVSKATYDSSDHDARTIYTVSDSSTGKVEQYLGDTKISGEGGGWEVETATILNTSNFDDFVIDAEEMAVVSPTTKLYYGATNRFIVVQGMLCYYGAWNSSSTISGASVLPPTINGSAEAFQAILDNWDYFSHCVGDMDDPSDSILMYNTNRNIRYVSLAISTQTATMKYSSGNEYITQTLKTFASAWSWTPAAYPTTLKFYNDLTPEEKATVTQVYKWGGSASAHNVYHNGSTQLPALASQYALIPIVTSISTQTTYNNYPTPYGYAECQGFFIIADGEWTGNVIDRWGQISGGNYANTQLPFKSQAELDFALGLTKRSEPSEVD